MPIAPARNARTSPPWSVFSYADFVDALESFLAAKRAVDPAAWTLGSWAKRLRMHSSSTLTNILKGRRVPPRAWAERIADSAGFRGTERAYFLLLADRARAATGPAESRAGIERALLLLRTKSGTKQMDEARFQAIANPIPLIVRETLHLDGFREDAKWVAGRLDSGVGADPNRIAESIRLLIEVGLLKRGPDGRLGVESSFYETTRDVPSRAHRRYHRACLKLAHRAIENVPVPLRDFSNSVLSVRSDRIPEMKEFVKAFNDAFAGNFDTTDGTADAIYHLGVQLYPVTRPGAKGAGNA